MDSSNISQGFPKLGTTRGPPPPPLGFDLMLMSTLPQSTPLTDTEFFLFFPSPAPVLGCQTVQSMTLLPSQQRNNRLCDKGCHDAARGTPNVEAGRSGPSFNQGQRLGSITGEASQGYNGNISLFLFVYLYAVCIHLSPQWHCSIYL